MRPSWCLGRRLMQTHWPASHMCCPSQGLSSEQPAAVVRCCAGSDTPASITRPDQAAISQLLSSLPGVELEYVLMGVFCQEVHAARAGQAAGLWLLPALSHLTTLSLGYTYQMVDGTLPAALPSVLSQGYLPQLQHLVFTHFPESPENLASLSQILCVRPEMKIGMSRELTTAKIDELRAAVQRIPAPKPTAASTSRGGTRAATAAAATTQGQGAVTLDEEGRRLLLDRLLC